MIKCPATFSGKHIYKAVNYYDVVGREMKHLIYKKCQICGIVDDRKEAIGEEAGVKK